MLLRRSAWAILAVIAVTAVGCYQTYDPYTGFNRYYPEFNLDYVNDLQPPLDVLVEPGPRPEWVR